MKENLVPVVISENGTVTKADTSKPWYDYDKKEWANAVILENQQAYENNQVIPEENIESYMVLGTKI